LNHKASEKVKKRQYREPRVVNPLVLKAKQIHQNSRCFKNL